MKPTHFLNDRCLATFLELSTFGLCWSSNVSESDCFAPRALPVCVAGLVRSDRRASEGRSDDKLSTGMTRTPFLSPQTLSYYAAPARFFLDA